MASKFSDPALDALMLPLAQGALTWASGPVLFLRARDGAALRQFPLSQLVCEQSFRPDAELLERAGLRVVADAAAEETRYALVLVLPPRQREEARALLMPLLRQGSPAVREYISASCGHVLAGQAPLPAPGDSPATARIGACQSVFPDGVAQGYAAMAAEIAGNFRPFSS